MISSATAHKARMRLMTHYVKRITELDAIFRKGGENSVYAIEVIRTERDQLEQCRTWLTKHADTDVEVAQLLVKLAIVGDSYFKNYLSTMDMLSWLELVLHVARRLDDSGASVKLTYEIATRYREVGKHDDAKQWALHALEMAERDNNLEVMADCFGILATLADDASNLDEAYESNLRALAICREIGYLKGITFVLRKLGWNAARAGLWDMADTYLNESYAISLQQGDSQNISNILHQLGQLAIMRGKYNEALSLITQALETALSIGDQLNTKVMMMDIATTHDTLGNFTQAKNMYNKVIQLFKVQGLKRLEAIAYGNLGYSEYLQSNFVDAVWYMEQALIILREQSQVYSMCINLANIIPAYLPLGQYELAQQALYEGLQLAVQSNAEVLKTTMVVASVQVQTAMLQNESNPTFQQSILEDVALWAGLIMAHPASLQENRDEIAKVLPVIEVHLGIEELNRQMQAGASLSIDAVIADILSQYDGAKA